jgi:hypothetical protein
VTTKTREPAWVPERRALKASQLATSLRDHGVTVDEAARFNSPQRRAAEVTAQVRKASEETWRQALDMLAGSTQQHALCPYCGHGDPEGTEGPPKRFGHLDPCSK